MKIKLFLFMILVSSSIAFADVTQPISCVDNVDANGAMCTDFTFGYYANNLYTAQYPIVSQDGAVVYGSYWPTANQIALPSDPSFTQYQEPLWLQCSTVASGSTYTTGATSYQFSVTLSCNQIYANHTTAWTGTIVENWQKVKTGCSGRGAHPPCYRTVLTGGAGTLSLQ